MPAGEFWLKTGFAQYINSRHKPAMTDLDEKRQFLLRIPYEGNRVIFRNINPYFFRELHDEN